MSNSTTELSGILRGSTGKGPSHRLRHAGLLPAIVYGKEKEATAIAISPKETTKALQSPLRRNIMMHLHLQNENGTEVKSKTVMVRDIQIHPTKRSLTHIDFVEINIDEPVAVNVPLFLFGKSTSVVAGGKLDQIRQRILVNVLPTAIPEKIELDITDLPFGSTHASAVNLPAGVTLADAPNTPVVTIKIPRADKEEDTTKTGTPSIVGAETAAAKAV